MKAQVGGRSTVDASLLRELLRCVGTRWISEAVLRSTEAKEI